LDLSESEWDQANTVIPAALKPFFLNSWATNRFTTGKLHNRIVVRAILWLSLHCNLFEKILKKDEFEKMKESDEDMNYLSSY